MSKILYFLFCGFSLFTLIAAVRQRVGIFQFPTLFSAAFAFSVAPQLYNHVFYQNRLPEIVYSSHGVELALLMCILCLAAGLAGHSAPSPHKTTLRGLIPALDVDKLFWAGAVLSVLGLYGNTQVSQLAGGFKGRFMEGGHYSLEWSGAPVLWAYVAKLLWLGLTLCLNSALRKGSVFRWGFVSLMMVYPIMNVIFLGRRSSAFAILALLAFSTFFQKRWVPPRWLAISAITICGLLIILIPHYRTYANSTGDVRGAIEQVDVESAMDLYLRGERQEGMDNLIIGIPARLKYNSYYFGSGLWNGAVDFLVPAQLIGRELKEGLMVKIGLSDDKLFNQYCNASTDADGFKTGPYYAFCEFWFLGALLFFPIGRFYRQLWDLAVGQRMLGAQALYTATVMFAPQAVVNSIEDVLPQFILGVTVIGSAFYFSRAVSRRKPLKNPKTSRRPGTPLQRPAVLGKG